MTVRKRLKKSVVAGPPWLVLALKEVGTKEWAGSPSNPTVEKYYQDAGFGRMRDEVPWCAAFIGACLKRAGIRPSGSLLARSYLGWGERSDIRPGAVVIFARGRPPQGHVAFVVGDEGNSVRVVGGNQGDAVTIRTYPKAGVLGYRWPSTARKAMKKGVAAVDWPEEIVTEVPVVNPNTTASNAVGIGAAATPLILWVANYFGASLTAENVAGIMSAISMIVGVFMFVKNRWFTTTVTMSSAATHGLKLQIKGE